MKNFFFVGFGFIKNIYLINFCRKILDFFVYLTIAFYLLMQGTFPKSLNLIDLNIKEK